jgi:hypothetical protein
MKKVIIKKPAVLGGTFNNGCKCNCKKRNGGGSGA